MAYNERVKHAWLLVRRTVHEYGEDNCSHLAAAISYYVLFSIIPLAIFLISVFGLVVRDEDVQQDVSSEIVDFLDLESNVVLRVDVDAVAERHGGEAVVRVREAVEALDADETDAVAAMLEDGEEVVVAGLELGPEELLVRDDNAVVDAVRGVSDVSGPLTIVGLVGMAWSASAMFGAIRKSLNIAWDTDVRRPVVQQKLVDLGLVFGLGVLLGISIAGTAALRVARELSDASLGPLSEGTGFVWSVLPLFLPAVFSFGVFLLLYRYVPNTQTPFRDVWPGAAFATVAFELLKNLFALYVANFDSFAGAYGALGGILLFMLWTYLTANILLVGAEVASEYPRVRRGDYDVPEGEAGPARPLSETVRRAVRGLFVRH